MYIVSLSLSCLFLIRSSKLIFKNADKEDFGTYSVSVTSTEGVSSSYCISAEGKILPIAVALVLNPPPFKNIQKSNTGFHFSYLEPKLTNV